MGLREFQDGDGITWKVWTVTADVLDQRTKAEDYMRDWQDGWLCFEHSGGRKRLARFPADWDSLPDEELRVLLDQAQSVKRRSGTTSDEYPVTGEQRTAPHARTTDDDRTEPTPP